MIASNRRSFLQLLGLCVSYGLLLVILLALTLWAAGALYFTLPIKEVRGLFAAIYAIAVLAVLVASAVIGFRCPVSGRLRKPIFIVAPLLIP
jgi:hypothetical protein